MTNISCLKGWKFIARHQIEFIHAPLCPKHVYLDLQYLSPHEAWQQLIFWGKSICCQHATRRTTNEIWITIMIIAWWYSNKFLSSHNSLSVLFYFIYLPSSVSMRRLFAYRWFLEFYSILFTCLPVSPCGDYLPTGYESHECFGPAG